MSDQKVFKLTAPVKAFGDEFHELSMRAPTTTDVRAINALPYVFSKDAGGVPTLVPDVCARYISRLANVPQSAVDQLELVDFHSMSWYVAIYFLQQLMADPQPT